MRIQKIHHVAYRCKDAKETVEWYGKYLDMGFVLAIAEDSVPSTGEPDPYMHVFLDAGQGNVLAFFELPGQPPMDRDRNTPVWTQHLALQVDTMDELLAAEGIDRGDLARWECFAAKLADHRDVAIRPAMGSEPAGYRLRV